MVFVRACRGRGLIWFAGVSYLLVAMLDLAADGGRESALLYGPIGFAVTFPILILSGKLIAAILNRLLALRNGICSVIIVAPALG